MFEPYIAQVRLALITIASLTVVATGFTACEGGSAGDERESAYIHIEVISSPGTCGPSTKPRATLPPPGPRCNLQFMNDYATAYDESGLPVGTSDFFDWVDVSGGDGAYKWFADIDTEPTTSRTLTVKVPGCGRARKVQDGDTLSLALNERGGRLTCGGLTPGT